MAVQQHPDYHQGFFDAMEHVPLFEGECSSEYEAGWRAWWEVRCLIGRPPFADVGKVSA